ncbi:MAG: DUF4998 domain-containing protein [Tissierellia bacterium]|nr:DUF4998 domain-containing protein [Tissierellia bacterium]
MNDLHMDYLLEGERIYVGQLDSVHAASGLNRVELLYWVSDPKSKKMKVYWNNDQDSLMVDIPDLAVNEPGKIEINNLEPKNYNFKIITYNDKWKNPSIPFEVLVEVYSENFLKRLFPRRIEYANFLTPESVYVSLYKPTDMSIGSVITYTNLAGTDVRVTVSTDTNFVVLDNFKENLKISTSFLPFKNALDTLYSSPKEFTEIDILLNKSLFKRWNPAGIPYKDLGAAYSIEKVWDNNYFGSFYIASGANSTSPLFDFTFDTGQEKRITRFKQWQRMTTSILYGEQQVKRFELWGSSSPDVTANLSDWVLLGSFEVKKPPTGTDLVKAAQEGNNFMVVGAPPVRYIRYRVLELFTNKGAMTVGELNFYSPD